jgi:hypothetical protein
VREREVGCLPAGVCYFIRNGCHGSERYESRVRVAASITFSHGLNKVSSFSSLRVGPIFLVFYGAKYYTLPPVFSMKMPTTPYILHFPFLKHQVCIFPFASS